MAESLGVCRLLSAKSSLSPGTPVLLTHSVILQAEPAGGMAILNNHSWSIGDVGGERLQLVGHAGGFTSEDRRILAIWHGEECTGAMAALMRAPADWLTWRRLWVQAESRGWLRARLSTFIIGLWMPALLSLIPAGSNQDLGNKSVGE